ncbi:MAG: hypothetical protein EOO73_01800 [Myxococcales bacterium]|nr:MAG: hypothetical protein EOO73_01800 [Myxococcales bacterium]
MNRASLLTSWVVFALAVGCKKAPEPSRLHDVARPAERVLASAGTVGPAWDALPSGAPYVPPQCYTKTRGSDGRTHNPCFTCHVDTPPPNYIKDGSLQLGYEFGPPALENRWTNLFVDRTAQVAAISDDEITSYVRRDNYIGLTQSLADLPAAWDRDHDGKWTGFVPDAAFYFDADGFDRSPDGKETGWRAYTYFPVPGGFWPTNGSFGDAMIRLPEVYRLDASGKPSRDAYVANLAILESLIARRDVPIPELDERALDADLDGNHELTRAKLVRYRWAPGGGGMTYAGKAKPLQAQLAAGLFPEGTELLHSLRYLDVQNGQVVPAARMKELRYMRKAKWLSFGYLETQAMREAREKSESPNKRRVMLGDAEHGISNAAGWRLQAFIEDAQGALRPQTLEEHAACIGCHSGVGATDDSVFSFSRKLAGDRRHRGWYAGDLHGIGEPTRADGEGEYSHYLAQNGAGDELRQNDELERKFFDSQGRVRPDMVQKLKTDVAVLLLPTAERALLLDKAYRSIVLEQSFTQGRDATIVPAKNVHQSLPDDEQPTGVTVAVQARRAPPRFLASAR